MRGPIDYIVVGFNNQKFNGQILDALKAAVENGTIDVLALSVVEKDSEGNVNTLDLLGAGDEYFVEFTQTLKHDAKAADQEDIDEVAELLEPNEAAGLLVIEHLWAKPLKEAILAANGYLIADGRIHPDAAVELDS